MRLRTIWVQADDTTWLEAAWEDEMTAENPRGWEAEIDRVRTLAHKNGYEMRMAVVEFNGGPIYDAFDAPVIKGTASAIDMTGGNA